MALPPITQRESPASLLAKLLTVDGAGSLLDADLLDGADWAAPLDIGTATPANATFIDCNATYFKTRVGVSGVASAPAFTFGGDQDTGMYQPGSNQLGFSAGGTRFLAANLSGTLVTVDWALSILGSTTFGNTADNTKRLALDTSAIATGTTRTLSVPDADVTISAFSATLLDDASASAARTTLGFTDPILDKASPGNIGTGTAGTGKFTSLEVTGPAWTPTVTLTDAANIATDASLSTVFEVTLGGNRTLDNPTNLKDGGTYIWVVTQDGTGSRTLAYGSAFKWPGGTAPTLSTAAGSVDIITAVSDGTNLYATSQLDFQ